MNHDDVISLARDAGFVSVFMTPMEQVKALKRFADSVSEAEREACAKIAQDFAKKWWSIHCDTNKHLETTRKAHEDFCKVDNAIRARGTKYERPTD